LANQLQIKFQYVNKWVALADLARIPGIGCQYCGLLLHAGIGSVVQLAQTPAHRLHQQILRLQVATMQRRDLCPHVDEVAGWIKQARALVVSC
jgi:predicted flap endonuclease-1-like 5' DNA nuclease